MLPLFEGCQNPHGCRKLAVKRVTVVGPNVKEEVLLCAYCSDVTPTDPSYELRIEDI